MPFVLAALGAAVLLLLGLAGCILPALPGPPLSWLGLVVVWAGRGFEAHTFGWPLVAILLGATVLVSVLDLMAPVIGARRYGASRWGTWGSIVGMLVGMFMFPPFGMIVGTFVGAFAGEMAAGQETRRSLRAAWGVFVGTMVGTVLKLIVSGVITWYAVVEMFAT
jgi:uncharacterized protein YqgC (DUF456 family)